MNLYLGHFTVNRSPSFHFSLDLFENHFRSYFNDSIPLLSEMAKYSFARSGQRIRPMFMDCLINDLHIPVEQRTFFDLASIVELVHAGTLFHDDVIDESEFRRGQKALHKIFGNKASILFGDYAFTEAYRLACLFPENNRELVDFLAATARNLVEGELWQLSAKNQIINWEMYEHILNLKTGCLFLFCTQSLVVLGTHRQELSECLDFSQNFGILYQYIDDYMDYFATAEILKKAPGKDFEEKKITCVILAAIDAGVLSFQDFQSPELKWDDLLALLTPKKKHLRDIVISKYDNTIKLLPPSMQSMRALGQKVLAKIIEL